VLEFRGSQSGETNNVSTPQRSPSSRDTPTSSVHAPRRRTTEPAIGNVVTLAWDDVNSGDFASGAYNDLVVVRNNTTGAQLVSTSFAVSSVAAGG